MYQLTVSKSGNHYFSTQPMQIKKTEAGRMYNHFAEVFPATEGYKISVYNIQQISTDETAGISKLISATGGHSTKDL